MTSGINRRHFLHAAALAAISPIIPSAHAGRAPQIAYGVQSTAEEVTDGLDLRGKTALITGCNSGIGYETMRVLAMRGVHVIGTSRTAEKAEIACRSVRGQTTAAVLELDQFDSIVTCANAVKALDVPIDMLICNAGIVLGNHETVNGIEKQFYVNHLGHFVLTAHLLDRVKAAPQGRVVVVGSNDHRNAPDGGIQFDHLSGERWHARGYSHSKLANGLFSLELARRLEGTKTTSNCVTPGHSRTNILREFDNKYREEAKTPAQGAASICHVATHPSLKNVSGKYFADCNFAEPGKQQTDKAMAAKLWAVSTELCKAYLP